MNMDVNAPFNARGSGKVIATLVSVDTPFVGSDPRVNGWIGTETTHALIRVRFFVRLPSIICPISACVFSGPMSRPRHQGRVRPYQTSDSLLRSRRDTDFSLKVRISWQCRPSLSPSTRHPLQRRKARHHWFRTRLQDTLRSLRRCQDNPMLQLKGRETAPVRNNSAAEDPAFSRPTRKGATLKSCRFAPSCVKCQTAIGRSMGVIWNCFW